MINKIPISIRVTGCGLAAVLAAVLVGLACVGCAPTAKPTAPSEATSPSSAPASAAPSATIATSQEPANLVASATVQQELLAAFIAFRSDAANTPGFAATAPSAVAGISPGTLYYAYDPSAGSYWAVATFSATTAASQRLAYVGFQDGGAEAVFTKSASGSWLVESVGLCLAGLPVGVAAMWGLAAGANPMCPNGVPAG
jgi:hypothetical protein